MPQFAVYRNDDRRTERSYPFLVEVQSDLFQDLQTCVVVPLATAGALTIFPLGHLTPVVVLEQGHHVLMTPQLAALTRNDLGPQVGSLETRSDTIIRALDFLLHGY